jgi:hypothetical protein
VPGNQQLVKPDTLRVNLQDPKCTRMATLLDALIKAKSMSTQGFFSQGFDGSKVLMANGPSWYGQYLFKSAFKTPAGQIAATGAADLGRRVHDVHRQRGRRHLDGLLAQQEPQGATALDHLADHLGREPGRRADLPGLQPRRQGLAGEPGQQAATSPTTSAPSSRPPPTGLDRLVEHQVQRPDRRGRARSCPALTAGKTLTETLPAWQQAITDLRPSPSGYTVTNQ